MNALNKLMGSLLLLPMLWGCQTPPSASPAAGITLRLSGQLDRLHFPIDPSGYNRFLTVTVEGGPVRSVWLAPDESSPHRVRLARTDDGQYQVNLYGPEVYYLLRHHDADGSFRILAEDMDGAIITSVSLRYTMPSAWADLDFGWDRATTTIFQRTSKRIPGSHNQLRLSIGDITAGQVVARIHDTAGHTILEPLSMREGEAVELRFGPAEYVLRLDEMVNVLAGHDFAVFSLFTLRSWEQERIDRLLGIIEASDAVFLRNGSETTAEAFAAHLRRKFAMFKPQALTAERFIEEVAGRSTASGDPCRVRLSDGQVMDAAIWLRQQAGVIPLPDVQAPK